MLTGGEQTFTSQDIIRTLKQREIMPGTPEFERVVSEEYVPVYEDPTGVRPTVYTERL